MNWFVSPQVHKTSSGYYLNHDNLMIGNITNPPIFFLSEWWRQKKIDFLFHCQSNPRKTHLIRCPTLFIGQVITYFLYHSFRNRNLQSRSFLTCLGFSFSTAMFMRNMKISSPIMPRKGLNFLIFSTTSIMVLLTLS